MSWRTTPVILHICDERVFLPSRRSVWQVRFASDEVVLLSRSVITTNHNSTTLEPSKMSPEELSASSPFVAQPLPKAQPPTPLFASINTAYSSTPVTYLILICIIFNWLISRGLVGIWILIIVVGWTRTTEAGVLLLLHPLFHSLP